MFNACDVKRDRLLGCHSEFCTIWSFLEQEKTMKFGALFVVLGMVSEVVYINVESRVVTSTYALDGR